MSKERDAALQKRGFQIVQGKGTLLLFGGPKLAAAAKKLSEKKKK